MKKLILSVMGLCLWGAQATAARQVLICKSEQAVEGWNAVSTKGYLNLTAYIPNAWELDTVVISGPYTASEKLIKKDSNYVPKAATYKNFDRFSPVEDAWHWFRPLLPKNYLSLDGPFKGYVQIAGERGYIGTVSVNCYVKN